MNAPAWVTEGEGGVRLVPPPRFDIAAEERAFEEWGANCGPGALAAIAGKTLDEIRPHMGDFESKRYTNPTLMFAALDSAGLRWWRRPQPLTWPTWGLARIQWTGPWTAPNVPPRVAYRHTHWVGAARRTDGSVGIFDINAMANGTGWSSLADWQEILVPWLLKECVPRADGGWFISHALEVEPQ